jgi:diguanylate cyclase (GGDEF)-like protein/PAS domain S-box-containing protein
MEHTGTTAPAVTPPRTSTPRFDPAAVTRAAAALFRSALATVLMILGVAVLTLGLAGESALLRLVVAGIVVVTFVRQAHLLRDRIRQIANEREATERSLQGEQRLKTLLERLPTAVYLDRYRRSDGAFLQGLYLSPQMETLTGYPSEAFLADKDLWLTLLHPEDKERVLTVDVNNLSGEPVEQEFRIIRPDGRILWLREETRMLPSSDADTVLSHGFIVDITERKALEQQLGRLAFQDPLTSLANRALFADRLAQSLARSKRTGLFPAVLFLDLDEFKAVNDSLGHAAGDRLLQVVGERLHGAVRPADCVARLGGDEFAVLLEEVTADVAIATANRLLGLLRLPIEIEGRQISGRGSMGIAVAVVGTATPNDLLRDADAAMYRAKALRRGGWVLFEPQMHTEALARFDLEADLRSAVAAGEITVVYQPIYAFATGLAGAVEALARWDHPTHGSISPLVFIEIAEASDLIFEVGRTILQQACRQVVEWRRDGTVADDFVLGVNVSAKQLTAELPGMVAGILAEAGLPAPNLVIEVTESAVMHDAPGAIQILTTIRETGVKVAIDDFGTGYSSLGYLQTLPIDIIKIDRTFVSGVEKPFEAALIRAVIQIADALSLRTVAEGIETDAQADALAALGCDYGQGHLYGVAQRAETCELRARRPRAA